MSGSQIVGALGALGGVIGGTLAIVSLVLNARHQRLPRLDFRWRRYLAPATPEEPIAVIVEIENRGVVGAERVRLWFPKYGSSHGYWNVEIDQIEPGEIVLQRVPMWAETDRPEVHYEYAGLRKRRQTKPRHKIGPGNLGP